MARKSRRNKSTEVNISQDTEKNKNLLDTAAYVRLSVENGGNETDETLVVQQMLVEKYIEEHPDLRLAGTYSDNGFSGTNFDRPGFIKLMEDVKTGKIQCIVVKDLSRFGRDYLETGYYLETILPRLNVRFIAITDDYDSSRKEDQENISVPLKNMVNAMYAKDMSKKILAAKDAQRRNGNVTLSKVAFGYIRSEDRHRQIVDEETAPFVRMIFQWYMMGVSKPKIADRLNLMGIATPGQREKMGNLTVPLEKTKWRADSVDKILNNPTYAGDIVTGKLKQALYKGVKQYKTSPEDWNIQRDMHQPMIARDDYEELQERANAMKKITKDWRVKYMKDREKYKDYFAGMVRCGDCGRTMYCVRYTHNYKTMEKVGIYYTCSAQNHTQNHCDQKIEENLLKMLVMDQIQILIKSLCDRKKLLQKLKSDTSEKNAFYEAGANVRMLERKVSQAEEKNATLSYIKTKSGENYFEDADGQPWRCLHYVPDSVCYQMVERPEQFYQSALSFGHFLKQLGDYPAESLYETIPKFHDTVKRFHDFKDALRKDVKNRARLCREEIEFVLAREDDCGVLMKQLEEGILPLRVTHNDTKLNNILFDKNTGEGLCIIDLDTIMPGLAANDFGDSIRFGASTAEEDEKDLNKVHFDIELYRIYVKGYLEMAKDVLTPAENASLPWGARLMTLECGMRFLADFLQGDVYFKTTYPEHNLVRARTQFRLVKEMEEQFDQMQEIVETF